MGPSRTVHLVDASPYIFRAYHSLPASIVDPDGEPVAAVYGFASFLIKLMAEEEPTHLGVAFDESLTTSFRNEIYPDYKAQRELPPPELGAQLDACQEVAAVLGAATYVDDRFEADDLIGTLCRQLEEAGHGAVVVTSDKDLAQLVTERVTLYDFARGRRYTVEGVAEKFGVRPEQIADYLALAGDTVDNIPGVAGVGAKSAVALLQRFDDLDELYAHLEEVGSLSLRGARSVQRKLEEGRQDAFLSRRLAAIARHAPATVDLEDLALAGARRQEVDALFDRLGFDRLRRRIPRWAD